MARAEFKGFYGNLVYYQILATENPCYKKNVTRSKTTHLILHSTGANNPNLKRYVGPDDGYLGENKYKNYWNSSNSTNFVHGVIGKNKNGAIECYQIAPWYMRIWGVGSGNKGSANDFAIQLEMCEDQTLGASYAKEVYKVAVKMYAHLCKVYGIDPSNIWSHAEAHAHGYGSNHGDPESWWNAVGSGLTMNGFRADVRALMNGGATTTTTTTSSSSGTSYKVKVSIDNLNIRKGPGTNYGKTGQHTGPGVFTIVQESGGQGSKKGWGKLKSGAGWISLDYVTRV